MRERRAHQWLATKYRPFPLVFSPSRQAGLFNLHDLTISPVLPPSNVRHSRQNFFMLPLRPLTRLPHQFLNDNASESDDSSPEDLAFNVVNEDGAFDVYTNFTDIETFEDSDNHVDVEGHPELLEEQIDAIMTTTRESLSISELCNLAGLSLVLLLDARPQNILRLRFRDLQIVLTRSPDGGPYKVLIRLRTKDTSVVSIDSMACLI